MFADPPRAAVNQNWSGRLLNSWNQMVDFAWLSGRPDNLRRNAAVRSVAR
jgi:hypothetical protein